MSRIKGRPVKAPPEPNRSGINWAEELRVIATKKPGTTYRYDLATARSAEAVKYRMMSGKIDMPGGVDKWEIVQRADGERSSLWVTWRG